MIEELSVNAQLACPHEKNAMRGTVLVVASAKGERKLIIVPLWSHFGPSPVTLAVLPQLSGILQHRAAVSNVYAADKLATVMNY